MGESERGRKKKQKEVMTERMKERPKNTHTHKLTEGKSNRETMKVTDTQKPFGRSKKIIITISIAKGCHISGRFLPFLIKFHKRFLSLEFTFARF